MYYYGLYLFGWVSNLIWFNFLINEKYSFKQSFSFIWSESEKVVLYFNLFRIFSLLYLSKIIYIKKLNRWAFICFMMYLKRLSQKFVCSQTTVLMSNSSCILSASKCLRHCFPLWFLCVADLLLDAFFLIYNLAHWIA